MSKAELDIAEGRVKIRGAIDFDTVPDLLRQSHKMFSRPESTIVVDFSEIEHTKSVGLALMIEWLRQARRAGKKVEFAHVPTQMLAMAKASGLESILGLQNKDSATS